MSSSVTGDVQALHGLAARLGTISRDTAGEVAKRAAGTLNTQLQGAFDSGQTVYGGARPKGKRGPLDLWDTGTTRGQLGFVQNGPAIRVVLGTPYARYLIRYGILPQRGKMPVPWKRDLDRLTDTAIRAQLEGGNAG